MSARRTLGVLAILAGLSACGGAGVEHVTTPQDSTAIVQPRPSSIALDIRAVSQTVQAGVPGEVLELPIIVRVTRGGLLPVAGTVVSFEARSGIVEPQAAQTDKNGEARASWRMPPDQAGVEGATLTARIVAQPASVATFAVRIPKPSEMDLVVSDAGQPVQLIAYRAGAFDSTYMIRRTFTDSTRLFVPEPAEVSELVAFTAGKAPVLIAPKWTSGRDTIRVSFAKDPIRIPITIWVVRGPFDSTSKLVQSHLAGMRDTWEKQGGIAFGDVRIVDVTAKAQAAPWRDTVKVNCDPTAAPAIGIEPGRINAYYLGGSALGSAMYCGDGVLQVYTLAWQRTNVILAHEVGHGFLGLHHETLLDNVMHFRGEGTTFSAGQIFRAHFADWSILNTMFNGHPPELRRACAADPFAAAPVCPPTGFTLR